MPDDDRESLPVQRLLRLQEDLETHLESKLVSFLSEFREGLIASGVELPQQSLLIDKMTSMVAVAKQGIALALAVQHHAERSRSPDGTTQVLESWIDDISEARKRLNAALTALYPESEVPTC